MAINELNHINIRTTKMEETKDFYVNVLGLEVGFRPPFDNHGYWIYCGDTAIVHLSPSESDSDPRTNAEGMGNGLDHIGLSAVNLDETLNRVESHGVKYEKRLAAGNRLVQVFFEDPNGVLVELAFDAVAEGVNVEDFEPVPA